MHEQTASAGIVFDTSYLMDPNQNDILNLKEPFSKGLSLIKRMPNLYLAIPKEVEYELSKHHERGIKYREINNARRFMSWLDLHKYHILEIPQSKLPKIDWLMPSIGATSYADQAVINIALYLSKNNPNMPVFIATKDTGIVSEIELQRRNYPEEFSNIYILNSTEFYELLKKKMDVKITLGDLILYIMFIFNLILFFYSRFLGIVFFLIFLFCVWFNGVIKLKKSL